MWISMQLLSELCPDPDFPDRNPRLRGPLKYLHKLELGSAWRSMLVFQQKESEE